MNSWNGFDFFILLIFTVNVVLGMSRGGMKELVSMICLCLALVFMIKFTVPLTTFFNSSPLMVTVVDSSIMQNFMTAIGAGTITETMLREIFYCLSLLLCFVGAFSACEAVLAITGFEEAFSLPMATLNRKLGATLGGTRGYVICLIIVAIFTLHLNRGSDGLTNPLVANSYFADLLQPAARKLDSLIGEQQPEKYTEIIGDQSTQSVLTR